MSHSAHQLKLWFFCSAFLLLAACGGTTTEPQIPSAPTDVTATAGPGYITITWKDNSDNETGFSVYRDDGSSASLNTQAATKLKDVAANTTEFIDTDIELAKNYRYSVVAKGSEGNSAQTDLSKVTQVPEGVDLMVGTLNRRWDPDSPVTGTVIMVYVTFPESVMEDPSIDMSATITGPAGWNNNNPVEFPLEVDGFTRTNGYTIFNGNTTDSVNGTYRIEVKVGSKTYKASVELKDKGFKIPFPKNIKITSSAKNSVTATWDATPGALGYWIRLWKGEYQEAVTDYLNANSETTFTFKNLNLEDGVYQVEVVPQSIEYIDGKPIKVESFGISYDVELFAIGKVNPACSNEQVVSIPDAALSQVVRDVVNKPTGDLTCFDLALITEIDEAQGTNKGIKNLEGLHYAINLRGLQLGENAITDASALSELENIEWLNLNNNQVSDLSPLQNLTNLKGLFLCCESNAYTEVSPLYGLII